MEALLKAIGKVREGKGSRIRAFVNGKVATFHRPHPEKEADKGTVRSVRRFLHEAGVKS
ncbi:MAG: type II toxin-antitoxin system HicA family toxin [Syntrophobacteraceae bacterium]